jgi:hypothetical protein
MQLWQLMMLGEAASSVRIDRDGDGQTFTVDDMTESEGN